MCRYIAANDTSLRLGLSTVAASVPMNKNAEVRRNVPLQIISECVLVTAWRARSGRSSAVEAMWGLARNRRNKIIIWTTYLRTSRPFSKEKINRNSSPPTRCARSSRRGRKEQSLCHCRWEDGIGKPLAPTADLKRTATACVIRSAGQLVSRAKQGRWMVKPLRSLCLRWTARINIFLNYLLL